MIQERAGKGKLRKEQGDFANAFMKYSKRYRGTKLGEKALYNAFQGYRKKKDRKHTFISGTQFIIQYPKSKYLRDIYPILGAIAFETANYDKACYYFEDYYRKFPRDKKAVELLAKAAELRTYLTDTREAISDYQKLINAGRSSQPSIYKNLAANYERISRWSGMINALQQARSLGEDTIEVNSKIAYANFKNRNFRKARTAIKRAMKIASAKGSARLGYNDRKALAHAQFISTEMTFVNFKNIQIGKRKVNEAKLVEKKNRYLQDMEQALVDVSKYRVTKWTVATIFRIGQAYADFGKFLGSTTVPKSLNRAQRKEYRKILNQKIGTLKKQSRNTFKSALSKAYKLNIFNNWVKSCARGYYIKEKLKLRQSTRMTRDDRRKVENIYIQLLSSPKNTKLLNKVALLYMRNGDFGIAKTILQRSVEIRSRSASTNNNLGVAHWYLGEDQDAYSKFARAITSSPKYTRAKINLAAIYYDYGNKFSAKRMTKKLKIGKINLNSINVIPPAKKLFRK